MPPVLQGPGLGFGWDKKTPTGGAGRPNLGGKYHHAVGVFSVQMASKKGGRRAPPCSWTNARMGGESCGTNSCSGNDLRMVCWGGWHPLQVTTKSGTPRQGGAE